MISHYLQALKENNKIGNFTDEGLTPSQIIHLEQLYNNSNQFPKILKELLLLAGNYCNCLDYGPYDSMQEMQAEGRSNFKQMRNIVISRPHFYVEMLSNELNLFIFLDEGDNPEINQIADNATSTNFFRRTGLTIKSLIEARIQDYNKGDNPF